MDDAAPASAPPPTPFALFLAFGKAGLLGFGGANLWVRRAVVEQHRWLSEREWAEILGMGQVLPGPNVGNAAVMIGRRFAGLPGAAAATAGLYLPPLAVLVGLMLVWRRYAGDPHVSSLMHGLACAAAGMVMGNVLRMASRLRPPPELIVLGLCAVAMAAWWRVTLPVIVLVLGPVGVGLVVWRLRRDAAEGRERR